MKKITFLFVILGSLAWQSLLAQGLDYGMCLDKVLAVRGEDHDSSEQVTQLLFGDVFKVTEKNRAKTWVKIENQYDGYAGWIPFEEVQPISKAYYENYAENNTFVADVGKESYATIEEVRYDIPAGATLPYFENGKIKIGDERFSVKTKAREVEAKRPKKEVIKTARSFLGVPYLWGGKGPDGFDCSGFTQVVYKMNGYWIPRDSYQQAERGDLVPFEEAQVGDLVFFQKQKDGDGRVVHVGIYLEGGQVIHAYGGEVRIDRLDKKGIYLNDSSKTRYLKFIKRF